MFLNEKKFERVKKETEEYKYPPIVHIQNRLNPSILEDEVEEEEDEKYKLEHVSKISGFSIKSGVSLSGNLTARKLQSSPSRGIDICRVSPMLSNVINTGNFISKKNSIFLKFKNDQLFQKPTTGRA